MVGVATDDAPAGGAGAESKSGALLNRQAVNFVSGGVAGCVAKSAIAPFDRVKILFQTNHPAYKYTGLWSTVAHIYRTEGLRGCWKGNSATVLRVFPYAAVQFMAYENYSRALYGNRATADVRWHENLIAGALAGATSVAVTYPLDLIRARLAADTHARYRGVAHGLFSMWRVDGARSLYKGMQPTLQGILPYAGVNFATFEKLKRVYRSFNALDDCAPIPVPVKLLAGAFAGAVGQTVSYPFDVVRRRMQTAGFAQDKYSIDYKWGGTLATSRDICRNEGVRALFRGISINYLKVSPAVGISFTTYEFVKEKLAAL